MPTAQPPSDAARRATAHAGALSSGTLVACSTPVSSPTAPTTPQPTATGGTVAPSTAPRTLLAYFSRPGENYYYGGRRDLEVGNTEALARMIAELIDCDTYRIEAGDPYPDSYDATVARNVREQDYDARPAIANPPDSITQYDTVLIGSPIWNVRTPMIMSTFGQSHDFNGKTVHPFVTYAVSGIGRAEQDYAAACPGAQLRPGLAIQGEEVPDHRADVEAWLREAGLTA